MATILVVDDDTAVRTFVARALKQRGHDVLAAADGEGALALLDGQTAIAAVISDIVMPGMDGVTLADAVTAQRPELPVLLMTGYAPDRTRGPDGEAPAYPIITKPFSLATICGAVDDLLDARA